VDIRRKHDAVVWAYYIKSSARIRRKKSELSRYVRITALREMVMLDFHHTWQKSDEKVAKIIGQSFSGWI